MCQPEGQSNSLLMSKSKSIKCIEMHLVNNHPYFFQRPPVRRRPSAPGLNLQVQPSSKSWRLSCTLESVPVTKGGSASSSTMPGNSAEQKSTVIVNFGSYVSVLAGIDSSTAWRWRKSTVSCLKWYLIRCKKIYKCIITTMIQHIEVKS